MAEKETNYIIAEKETNYINMTDKRKYTMVKNNGNSMAEK